MSQQPQDKPASTEHPPMDTITIKVSIEDDREVFRWRYQAEGNNEDMGGTTQPYNSFEDCMAGVTRVCGVIGYTVADSGDIRSLNRPDVAGDLHLVVEEPDEPTPG